MPKYPTKKPHKFPLDKKVTGNYNRPIVFDSDLLFSKAYHDLSNSGKLLLAHFYTKRKLKKVGGKRSKEWVVLNKNELVFPYDDALERGITKPMFSRGLDSLLECGFIRIVKQGGGMLKDFSVYGLIDEWEKYGTDEFKFVPRAKDTRKLGFKKGVGNPKPETRFKTEPK